MYMYIIFGYEYVIGWKMTFSFIKATRISGSVLEKTNEQQRKKKCPENC